MKKRFFIVMLLTILGQINSSIAENKTTITVNQFVSHVALDAAYNGLVKGLEERGILPNKAKVIMANAQGNIGNSAQIAKHQASVKPEFMVAIATPSAQVIMKAKTDSSILAFLAVSDPEAINLTNHDDVIGTVERLEKMLKDRNITLKKIAITNSNDIKNAFNKLIGEVDLIYIPQDNTVVSALASMVSMSRANKIPLIANDPTLVEQGVMLAFGTNYFRSGEQLGNMIADLIEGKKLEKNIQNTNIKELKVNDAVLKELGIVIPENIKLGEN